MYFEKALSQHSKDFAYFFQVLPGSEQGSRNPFCAPQAAASTHRKKKEENPELAGSRDWGSCDAEETSVPANGRLAKL